jgi:hypothetical protein
MVRRGKSGICGGAPRSLEQKFIIPFAIMLKD